MHGNVSEWCWDWSDKSYYITAEANVDPKGPLTVKTYRVVRGGSWTSAENQPRSANRGQYYRYSRYDFIGIRLARTTM